MFDPMDNIELTLKPSQWINIGWVIFGVLGIPLVFPPLIALWKILEVSCHRYDFYDDRITETSGVINVTTNEIYYHRIKGTSLEEPILYRIVGLSTLHVRTSDPYVSELNIVAIPIGKALMKDLKNIVKASKKKNGVKEFDMFSM
jgi:uncharacterized membrane protein YdbT with pleckstrin-like domain